MGKTGKRNLITGVVLVVAFIIWTILIKTVDVQSAGVNGTEIGFATVNKWFHTLTGVNWSLYNVTDWLGLGPVFVCMAFGIMGFVQIITRKSLLKVDKDIVYLGIYYVIVIAGYLLFEAIPVNYRPVLVNGFMEASYPSSTALLVVAVMPTLVFQINRRVKNRTVRRTAFVLTVLFSVFMVTGRLVSGVHWVTDIVGSLLFSAGLFQTYKGIVFLSDKK